MTSKQIVKNWVARVEKHLWGDAPAPNSDKTICMEAIKAIQKKAIFQQGNSPEIISDTEALIEIESLCTEVLQHIV